MSVDVISVGISVGGVVGGGGAVGDGAVRSPSICSINTHISDNISFLSMCT